MVIVTSSAIDCDVISRTKTERVRHGDDEYRSSFLLSFLDSLCHVRNKIMHVILWQTVSALTRVLQYIPRNMHTVFALLCFVVVIHWLIFPYPSGLLHWHCGNLTIAPVPAKQPWWIWINTSFEFIMNYYITTTKQSTTKPCAYFLGYTVLWCLLPSLLRNPWNKHKNNPLVSTETVRHWHTYIILYKFLRIRPCLIISKLDRETFSFRCKSKINPGFIGVIIC